MSKLFLGWFCSIAYKNGLKNGAARFTTNETNQSCNKSGCCKLCEYYFWCPFLERPGNSSPFRARRQLLNQDLLNSSQFLAHKPLSFASLNDSFIVSFSNLLEPLSWMQTRQTRQTRNSFSGPKRYQDFWETVPWLAKTTLESHHAHELRQLLSNKFVLTR